MGTSEWHHTPAWGTQEAPRRRHRSGSPGAGQGRSVRMLHARPGEGGARRWPRAPRGGGSRPPRSRGQPVRLRAGQAGQRWPPGPPLARGGLPGSSLTPHPRGALPLYSRHPARPHLHHSPDGLPQPHFPEVPAALVPIPGGAGTVKAQRPFGAPRGYPAQPPPRWGLRVWGQGA